MNPKMASVPNPNLSDNMLAFSIAQNLIAALSNHVTGGATPAAAAVVPYTMITSPLITRKSSGIFLVWVQVTVSVHGGNLVDGDNLTYNPTRVTPGAVALNPIMVEAASTTTGAAAGYLVSGILQAAFIDTPAIAMGATASYGLTLTNANGHTSGVIAATDGNIVVLELPG